ncbi:MAG TPA: hypothetical protein VFP08_10545, partial [Acidimicrobiales bacterium]|nr:hypothetical protein [Acidimicrobiales bacterium]
AGEIRYSGALRGIPTPPDAQSICLTRCIRLDDRSVPSPLNRLARFHGWFECDERDDGTHVRHREQFEFSPLVAWLAAPILRRWLLSSRSSPVVTSFGALAGIVAVLAAGWKWVLSRPWPWRADGARSGDPGEV